MNGFLGRVCLYLPVLATILASAHGQTLVYLSADKVYSVSIPSPWEPIAKTTLTDRADLAEQQLREAVPTYELALKLGGHRDFEYPYMLIQRGPANPLNYADLKRYMAANFKSLGDEIGREMSEKVGKTKFTTMIADDQRKMLFVESEGFDRDGVRTKGKTAYCLGRRGLIFIHLYSTAADYDLYVKEFGAIARSFQFQPGHEYGQR